MTGQLIQVGKLSLLYENGFVRYIRAGEIEMVRMIYLALRDSNWATADIVRSNENISVRSNGFDISYTATNKVDGKDVFCWNVKINGAASGEIEFSIDGEALATYTRNRAGICVLHPIRETRGQVVKITRPDRTIYESKFPSVINPHQPFLDITKMTWHLGNDAWAELQFEGDVFETEDQRNWSDTSFKTYSTPLSKPYPVTLQPGDRVNQKVKFRLINSDRLSYEVSDKIEVTIDESSAKSFPKMGLDFSGKTFKSKKGADLISALTPDHLRVEVALSSAQWKNTLKTGLEQAKAITTNVFLHLVLTEPGEFDEFVTSLSEIDVKSIVKLAVSPSEKKGNVDELLKAIVPKVKTLFPGISFGAGFTSYFTELNRNRFDYTKIDFVIYPVIPQAHATDTRTLIDNLAAQTDAVTSARSFATGKKIHVGPVSLKSRAPDERQSTPLAAGWMIASIKYLSEGGADSITMFQSNGGSGYFIDENTIFPAYEALLSLIKIKPRKVTTSRCNEPLIISSLVVESENGKRCLILVNHTDSTRSVTVGKDHYTLGDYEIKFIVHEAKVIPLYK